MQDLPAAAWRTSTLCDLNGCVEVALLDGRVAVRDAKDRTGPVLLVHRPRVGRLRGRRPQRRVRPPLTGPGPAGRGTRRGG